MTTYTVTNNNDSGIGSLRWAISQANDASGLDTIEFTPEVSYITINSAILISDSVSIIGNKATVAQTGNHRIFNISDGSDELIDVTISNLTLTGGRPTQSGGAILTRENLSLSDTTIVDNVTTNQGGAIYSLGGNLAIINSTLKENQIVDGDVSIGGAIYIEDGTLSIRNATIENNRSQDSVVAINGSKVEIANSEFDGNNGGAIFISDSQETNIELSKIINNTSQGDGAGIVIVDSEQTTILNSIIRSNQGVNGGGLAVDSSQVSLIDSSVVRNSATEAGGGIFVTGTSSVEVNNSTIGVNEAPLGSAIAINGEDSDVLIANVNIVNNQGSETQLAGDNITFDGGNTGGILYPNPVTTPNLVAVERFYQREQGFHFYTSDPNESATIQAQSEAGLLNYNYENTAYSALGSDTDFLTGEVIEGAKPVYRFFNTETGSHLYTMDENEKNYIQDNLTNYSFEDISYYAFAEDSVSEPEAFTSEIIPVYRLLNSSNGTHLFTADANEVNYIQDNLANFTLEGDDGIAFYVFGAVD